MRMQISTLRPSLSNYCLFKTENVVMHASLYICCSCSDQNWLTRHVDLHPHPPLSVQGNFGPTFQPLVVVAGLGVIGFIHVRHLIPPLHQTPLPYPRLIVRHGESKQNKPDKARERKPPQELQDFPDRAPRRLLSFQTFCTPALNWEQALI